MKTLLVSVALAAALLASPASARSLGDIFHDFDNHCSLATLSCSVSHGVTLKLPNQTVWHQIPDGSRGPGWSACGFEQINPNGMKNADGSLYCVADFSSWMTTAPGSYDEVLTNRTGPGCKTTTGQITHSGWNPLTGWNVTVSSNTVSGVCP